MATTVASDIIIISNCSVEVNDVQVPTYGDSVKFKPGYSAKTVSSLNYNGAPIPIHTEDTTKAIGEVTFKAPNTAAIMTLIKLWASNVGTNTVTIKSGDFSRTLGLASLTSDVEFSIEMTDGGVELVFQGAPLDGAAAPVV